MAWGGKRDGSGRKANPRKERVVATPKLRPTVPAEPKKPEGLDARVLAEMLPQLAEISQRYSRKQPRTNANNPFRLPKIPAHLTPPLSSGGGMAMDNALVQNLEGAASDWLGGGLQYGVGDQGLQFLGYPYLAELAQRPEYRVMSETIADDATRKWIDFDVTGDEKEEREAAARDPEGHAERAADPDERTKRVAAAGKADKVKALQDDQLRLGVKQAFYDQSRNGSFFGRSHLFLDIWTGASEPDEAELKTSIGDGRDATSKSKVPPGSFKALRTIEAVWTYPQAYNALNPLAPNWYNPQQWYVMGREAHVSRLQVFIPHPVPDMLKPAYAFGGLSLTQMAKPYVDIWLDTKQSVADLIRSFSVMILSTDLATLMSPGSAASLIARAAMSNMLRDNQGLQIVNKNTEEFSNVAAPLGGLNELQAQSQEHVASVHRIPLVKFTGIQPAGLNASSEGEIKVYDDTIGGYQSRVFDPNLSRVINFQQLSLFGEIDPQITHRWEPLREMTQAEKGQKEKDDKDRDQGYVDMGAISPAEVRKVIIENKDLPYTGLDPDDVPELDQEEEEGLEPGGKKPGDGESGGGANDAAIPFVSRDGWSEGDHPRDEAGKFSFSAGGGGGESLPTRPDAFHGSGQAYQSGKRDDPLYLTNRLPEAAGFARGAHLGGEGEAPQVHSFHMRPGKVRDINKEIEQALNDGDDLDDAISKVIAEELGSKGTARYLQFLHPSVAGGGDFDALIALHPGQDLEHIDSAELASARAWKAMQKASMATDAWSESDHPRGQPDNAGQFGSGGGGGKTPRKYGGLYKQTGQGAKADHLATVEHVLKNPPRAGVSYRELLTRLVKDAPELGGEVDQLKQHLAQAYENARQQLQVKALTAASHEESVKFDAMAKRAGAKAEALGWKPPAPATPAWVDAGDPSPELRGFREKAQRDLVERGKKTGKEDIVGFNLKSGKPVIFHMTETQSRNFVGFSPELMEAMKKPTNSLELHHNHPNDTSLSLDDLEVTQAYPGLAKTYAHGHAGSVYWCAGVREGVRKARDAANRAIYLTIGVAEGLDGKQKSWMHAHVLNTALHQVGLVEEYGCVPSREAAAMLETHKKQFSLWVENATKAIKRGHQ